MAWTAFGLQCARVPPPYSPGGFAPQPPAPLPPRKSRSGLIIGMLLVVVVLLVSGLGIALYALNARNQQGQAGAGATATSPLTTPSPTATPGGTILFQDPLTSNANGWLDSNGHCFFQDNAYHIKNSYYCLAPAGNIADANISVQAKQVAGSLRYPYGIVFRRASSGNWYEFDIDSNSKWVFFKVVNGTLSTLVNYTPNAAIKGGLNTAKSLMVQAKGSHFVFFVNGTNVGDADDSTFASGSSGLSAGGPDTEVAYNNFLITTGS